MVTLLAHHLIRYLAKSPDVRLLVMWFPSRNLWCHETLADMLKYLRYLVIFLSQHHGQLEVIQVVQLPALLLLLEFHFDRASAHLSVHYSLLFEFRQDGAKLSDCVAGKGKKTVRSSHLLEMC